MKLGLSMGALTARYGYEKAFKICRESGFDSVEIGIESLGNPEKLGDIYYASDDEFETYFYNIRKLAEAAEIEISSTHGRGTIDTPDKEHCDHVRWACKKDLKATGILGAEKCVIHSIVNSHWEDRYDDEEFLYKKNAEFFDYVSPVAEENNVKICLETYGKVVIDNVARPTFFSRPHEMKKQFESLKTKNKTICVDIGHTNESFYRGASSPGEMIRYLGGDVTHLHLHDNNGTVDMHAPPLFDKRGGIDWPDIFDALDEINYKGVYHFEVKLRHYGDLLEEATRFYGKYFRYLVENKGRIV